MWDSYEQFKFQLDAVLWNLYDWLDLKVLKRQPVPDDDIAEKDNYCYLIHRPGSINQVRKRKMAENECTIGYNLPPLSPGPVITIPETLPEDCVLLKVTHFSVNYADVCIRWGLYDSANKFVGWPICPGFDVAGVVERAGTKAGFKPGDSVFGATLFGGYSSRVLVPVRQLRKVPKGLEPERAAALPAVCHTAVHALHLAGFSPDVAPRTTNKGVLVHSAAGGVGTMLCTLAKRFGCSPVVGVVGRPQKIQTLKDMGICDSVVLKTELWQQRKAKAAVVASSKKLDDYNVVEDMSSPSRGDDVGDDEFQAIFDANGQETLAKSYSHLAQGGRLIIYGFHTNVPSASAAAFLSPWQWLKMLYKMVQGMPRFDPMNMTVASKGAIGFNLSFFAKETEVLKYYFDMIVGYVEKGVIGKAIPVTVLKDAREAHTVLSSAASVGKLVVEL
ncbi:unnamed protein product [Amoebophrya sp. A120]|nr:unnamed protein product [Amoebophrya sp. A120]|eukprot:GSA120T00005084001.1